MSVIGARDLKEGSALIVPIDLSRTLLPSFDMVPKIGLRQALEAAEQEPQGVPLQTPPSLPLSKNFINPLAVKGAAMVLLAAAVFSVVR